jgi:hypothetical protein
MERRRIRYAVHTYKHTFIYLIPEDRADYWKCQRWEVDNNNNNNSRNLWHTSVMYNIRINLSVRINNSIYEKYCYKQIDSPDALWNFRSFIQPYVYESHSCHSFIHSFIHSPFTYKRAKALLNQFLYAYPLDNVMSCQGWRTIRPTKKHYIS